MRRMPLLDHKTQEMKKARETFYNDVEKKDDRVTIEVIPDHEQSRDETETRHCPKSKEAGSTYCDSTFSPRNGQVKGKGT